jgi:hypothetical protein
MVVADSKPTRPLRAWVVSKTGEHGVPIQLLECPACQSFWYGLLTGIFILHLGAGSFPFALLAYAVSILLTHVVTGVHNE